MDRCFPDKDCVGDAAVGDEMQRSRHGRARRQVQQRLCWSSERRVDRDISGFRALDIAARYSALDADRGTAVRPESAWAIITPQVGIRHWVVAAHVEPPDRGSRFLFRSHNQEVRSVLEAQEAVHG